MENRIFISANIADSMTDCIAQLGLDFNIKFVSPDELKGLKFYSLIKNKALVGTLNDMGISAEICNSDSKINLTKGDILYVVNPNRDILKLSNEDRLPGDTTITIKKYTVK
jgi:hypothetical protein